ncbi:histidine kinase [Planctomycetota bacterium]|nr:histidine kinase [Planctomycetota bacterium]
MQRTEFPGNLDSLRPIGEYILAAAKTAGLEKKKAYGLRLAMDEVATNIITHGYDENGKSGSIIISGEVTERELILVLEDTAPPFDPRSLLSPEEKDLKRPLEERNVGGLGVFLAFKALDRFDYQHTGTHNRNVFVMHRPQPAGTPHALP